MTQQFEPEKNGFTLRNPDTGETFSLPYAEYGWNPDKDVEYYASIPCFSATEMNLLIDVVLYGENRVLLSFYSSGLPFGR